MNNEDMKSALNSWIASAQMRSVQDYMSRGRHFEHTPQQILAEDWVSLMRAWAAAPEEGQDSRQRDIEAEYSLRCVQPPYERVRAEMEALARAAAALIQQIDAVAGEEIDSIILDQSSHEKRQAN